MSRFGSQDQSSARFRVMAETEFADAGQLWASCADVEGFFVVPADPRRLRLMRLVDASVSGPLREFCAGQLRGDRVRSNAYLQVLGPSEEIIGQYFMTVFQCTDCVQHTEESARAAELDNPHNRYDATLEIMAEAKSPLIKGIWDRWRREMPTTKNLWADYKTESRMAWLDVVRTHYRPGSSPDAPPGRSFELDGRYITDYPGFFCAIGEAVNGPGGYFGGDLEALNDCLNGGFGAKLPFELVWHGFGVASQHIDKPLYGRGSLLGEPPSGFDPFLDMTSDNTHVLTREADVAPSYLEQIVAVLEGKSVTIIRD